MHSTHIEFAKVYLENYYEPSQETQDTVAEVLDMVFAKPFKTDLDRTTAFHLILRELNDRYPQAGYFHWFEHPGKENVYARAVNSRLFHDQLEQAKKRKKK